MSFNDNNFNITTKMKNDVLNHPKKYIGCDVRTRMGKFRTDEEQQRYIEESLKRKLPGDKKIKVFKKI